MAPGAVQEGEVGGGHWLAAGCGGNIAQAARAGQGVPHERKGGDDGGVAGMVEGGHAREKTERASRVGMTTAGRDA